MKTLKKGEGGYVFISHSHKDIKKVRVIRNAMEEEGFEPLCFYLKCLTEESEIDDLIFREIDARDWFVFADSKNARESSWVQKERAYIESKDDNKCITIDLDTGIELETFSKKLVHAMQVLILFEEVMADAADTLLRHLLKKDLRVYSEPVGNRKDLGSFPGCVVLMCTADKVETMLSPSGFNAEKTVFALAEDDVPTKKKNDRQGNDESMASLAVPEAFLSQDIVWTYISRSPTVLQLERIGDTVENILLNQYNETEDEKKLEMNCDRLKSMYPEERFVCADGSSADRIIPVRKDADLCHREIVVRDDPAAQYQLPEFIRKNEEALMAAHRSSHIYDNVNIRVNDWYLDEAGRFVVVTQRTTYFSSLKTNRAMDFRLENDDTIRKHFAPGPRLPDLKESELSDHLGFNGMIESSDHMLFLVFRKNNLSISKHRFANSICASLKTKYALDPDGRFRTEGIYAAMKAEILDEIGIQEEGIEPEILTAYRDVQEGGKPQFFFFYQSALSRKEISACFRAQEKNISAPKRGELKQDKIVRTVSMDGERIVWIDRADFIDPKKTKITQDQLQTVLVDENREKHAELLQMSPTCTACMQFLRDYYNGGTNHANS